MSQDKQFPNRAARRQAEREIRKAIKSGVGIGVTLAGYRVVRADGSVKYQAGRAPTKNDEANHDS